MLNLVFDQHSINLYDDDNDDDAECIYIYCHCASVLYMPDIDVSFLI